MMALNLPRERRGVLRPLKRKPEEIGAGWWVYDDLGPFCGPYATLAEAWTRIEEIYAADKILRGR